MTLVFAETYFSSCWNFSRILSVESNYKPSYFVLDFNETSDAVLNCTGLKFWVTNIDYYVSIDTRVRPMQKVLH